MRVLGSTMIVLMLASACTERNEPTSTGPSSPARSTATVDAWLGQWTGPEGTFLRIAGGQGAYQITVQNLDGPKTFPGSGVEGRIEFERAGIKEAIRATDGVGTGMKWLAEKKDCLLIRPGEGFCRD